MRVTLTQKHIDNGISGNRFFCPLALAIQASLPKGYTASVGHVSFTIINDKGKQFCDILPSKVEHFPQTFDTGGIIYPTHFELNYRFED